MKYTVLFFLLVLSVSTAEFANAQKRAAAVVNISNLLLLNSNLALVNVEAEAGLNSAEVIWSTNEFSRGQVEYGTSTALGMSSELSSEASQDHRQTLGGLDKFTVYYYRIVSFVADQRHVSELMSFRTEPHDIDLSSAVLASSFGYNSSNATTAFRAAINSDHSIIVIDKQDSDWLIDPTRFFDTSKIIVFEEGVIVRARPGAFSDENDRMIDFLRPKDLEIYGYGAAVTMNKAEYTSGEGRHALSILSGDNVRIEGLNVSDSGGDGLYIASSLGVPSSEIYVDNMVFDNNRRQGMSIINARNVWVSNSTFMNTNGTLPEAGVDLEPNRSDEILVNINFDRCRFINNGHAGFLIAADKLTAGSEPISVNVSNSYFSMNHDESNAFATGEIAFGANRTDPVDGMVRFENIEIDGSDWGIFSTRKPGEAYEVQLVNVQANNIGQANLDGSGIFTLEVPSYSEESTLGNLVFDNVSVQSDSPLPVFYIYDWRTLSQIQDMSGTITVTGPSNVDDYFYRNNLPIPLVNVSLDIE